ncbi:MAG: serine/threonine-protein kinase [Myxococcota bacterium]
MNRTFCPACRRYFTALERCPVHGSPLSPLPRDWPVTASRFGDYVLSAPIAAGGMSRIYRGTCERDSRPVAIKVLNPALVAQAHTVERFFREARISRLLDHANIVGVEAFGVSEGGHPMMVMELLGGESLEATLRHGPIPWPRAVHIAIQLCQALGHAHSRRIVHRDVKPANVQLTGTPGPDERALLIDFGIAYVASDHAFTQAAPGSLRAFGTPAYMSPEQIRAQPLDGRSDVYSLGVVLFEMLTGRRPYQHADPAEVCRMHLHEHPPSLRAAAGGSVVLPRALEGVVSQALSRDRASRHAGVGALLAALEALESLPPDTRRRGLARTRPRTLVGQTATLYGVPAVATGTRQQGAAVALLHVSLAMSNGEDPADAPEVAPKVSALISAWRARVERAGGWVQEPALASARAFVGLLAPGESGRQVVLRAIQLFDTLRASLPAFEEAGGPPVTLHGGLVMRADREAADPERGLVLGDVDAEAAWYLALASPGGALLIGARARFAIGDAREVEPVPSVARPADLAALPAWRLVESP